MTTFPFPAAQALVLALAAAVLRAQDPRETPERPAHGGHEARPGAEAPAPAFRLLDVSLDLLTAVGTSTERDHVLRELKGGGHDPRKRGFSLRNVELSLAGAVDPYFRAEAHVVTYVDAFDQETVVELEEAFLTTQALPAGLQLEVGQSFTEFGLHNPRHPHAWSFLDQPVILSRVFGPDGMRGPGARLSWVLPLPFFAELHGGVQNASGETMASFLASDEFYEERAIGGRSFVARDVRSLADLVWLGRLRTSFGLGAETSLTLGASVLFGPNATGPGADTQVFGADFTWHWHGTGGSGGRPLVTVEGEVVARRFVAAEQVDVNDPGDPGDDFVVARDTLEDLGAYVQVLWNFAPRWTAGLRGEWASGAGGSYVAATDRFDRAGDPFRADRVRLSSLLSFELTEFSRIRLQYDFDDSDAHGGDAHSVWLGFDVNLGKHAAHAD